MGDGNTSSKRYGPNRLLTIAECDAFCENKVIELRARIKELKDEEDKLEREVTVLKAALPLLDQEKVDLALRVATLEHLVSQRDDLLDEYRRAIGPMGFRKADEVTR